MLSAKMSPAIAAACALLMGLGALTVEGVAQTVPRQLPSKPPRGYFPIIPCQNQLGQVWAPPTVSRSPGGNEPPMLGFYQGRLVGMVFYLSEKHLYPLLPGGDRWNFQGDVNATADSITLAPAQLRPNRDKSAYELTVMVHHDTPITITCAAANMPAVNQGPQASQGQTGGSTPNQGSGNPGGFPGGGGFGGSGSPGAPGGGFGGPFGGGTKRPPK